MKGYAPGGARAALKRIFDATAAFTGLLVFAPVGMAIAVWIKLDSRGPVFYRQVRVGRGFRNFRLFKFRTMITDAEALRGPLTHGEADPRITPVGKFLRRTKLDEIPQLLNVLVGDMSLVGPRPEVPRYVDVYRQDYEELLRVRPGVTDLASLKYIDEGLILGVAEDPERFYLSEILPDKIRIAREYLRNATLSSDLRIIFRTVTRSLGRDRNVASPVLPVPEPKRSQHAGGHS